MNLDFLNNFNKKIENSSNDLSKDLNNFLESSIPTFNNGESFTVDRFENNFVVLENRKTGKMINIAIDKLPNNSKEGDILLIINGQFILDKNDTCHLHEDIQSRLDRLKKKQRS